MLTIVLIERRKQNTNLLSLETFENGPYVMENNFLLEIDDDSFYENEKNDFSIKMNEIENPYVEVNRGDVLRYRDS